MDVAASARAGEPGEVGDGGLCCLCSAPPPLLPPLSPPPAQGARFFVDSVSPIISMRPLTAKRITRSLFSRHPRVGTPTAEHSRFSSCTDLVASASLLYRGRFIGNWLCATKRAWVCPSETGVYEKTSHKKTTMTYLFGHAHVPLPLEPWLVRAEFVAAYGTRAVPPKPHLRAGAVQKVSAREACHLLAQAEVFDTHAASAYVDNGPWSVTVRGACMGENQAQR